MGLLNTIHSIFIFGIVAGTFLWDPSPKDEVFLGVGPRISVRHNEPSPAQAALEDVLTIDRYEDEDDFESIREVQLSAGESYKPQETYKSNPIALNTSKQGSIAKYQPRPSITISEQDLNEILLAMETAKRPSYLEDAFVQSNSKEEKYVATSQGAPIIIRPAQVSLSQSEANPKDRRPSFTDSRRSKKSFNGAVDRRTYSRSEDTPRNVSDLIHPSEVEWGHQGLILQGHIGVTEGLLYNPEEHLIELYQLVEGIRVEYGEVNINSAEFYIAVSEASGRFIAEMRTRAGELIGAGHLESTELPHIERNVDEIDGLQIHLRPTSELIEGQVISAYSYRSNIIPEPQAQTFIAPFNKYISSNGLAKFRDEDYLPGSESILTTHLENHWSKITRIKSSVFQRIEVFTDKDIEATYANAFPEKHENDLKRFAIVKGRIIKEGRGVSGAKVEVEGDATTPIYYESFLPRPSLTETTSTGEFIIFTEVEGPRYIRVSVDGVPYPAQWVDIKQGHISEVIFDVDFSRSKNISIADGLYEEGLEATGKYVGVEEQVGIYSGVLDLLVPKSDGHLEMDVDAGDDYPITRFTVNHKSELQRWQLLRYENLEVLLDKSFQQDTPCPIIGWLGEDIEMISAYIGEDPIAEDQIIYLDRNGERVNAPVSGGGFLVDVNEEEVVHVQAVPTSGSKILNRYMLRDSRVCQVLSF